jgi:2,3-bisphosphoglycerate-independent phosphoglycerate mutase
MQNSTQNNPNLQPTNAQPTPKPVVLCVLDGWGHRVAVEHNAIAAAKTPNWDRISTQCPHGLLEASALDVGLPPGQMGNSEVGHMNIGAGRVVMQNMPRIDAAIIDGSLALKPELAAFVEKLKSTNGTCHLMGLISTGGVHSHQDEIAALARILDACGIRVAIHVFLDGRDSPPKSAIGFLQKFEADIGPGPKIVTVTGRYYAMDRDTRWERIEQAYDGLVSAKGAPHATAQDVVNAAYANDITDEFVTPAILDGYQGMKDGDGIVMGNFRSDRAREILGALVDPKFDGFERSQTIALACALGMTEYSTALNTRMESLFKAQTLNNILGDVLSRADMSQLRIAETEKYAHVTFFFNGGVEEPMKHEERILVPSPKVATYDLEPEMSAKEVTDHLVSAIGEDRFDFILVNYANGDMIGHTGNFDAAVITAQTVDQSLGRLEKAVIDAGGVLMVTADHGNAEQMYDSETGQPHTAHTTNLVPLILVNGPEPVTGIADGRLADIAPTVLALLGLSRPAEMTGKSLLEPTHGDGARERIQATA